MTSAQDDLRQGIPRPLALAIFLLVWLVFRCVSSTEPFPHWSGDPLTVAAPVTGLTIRLSLWIDLAALLIASGVLAARGCAWLRDGCAGWMGVALAAFGLCACIVWSRGSIRDALDNTCLVTHWIASIAAALALATIAHRHAPSRRVIIGVVLALPAAWACKSISQVYFERPALLADFGSYREQFFASQGWSSDSVMARAFERRMRQPDATGWTGMSNVLACTGAAAFTVSLAWGWGARRGRAGARLVGPAILSLCAGLILWHARSKGGYAAAALGGGLLIAGALARTRGWRRAGAWIGIGAPAAALLAVLARGALGERLGELSLLFRWFYLQASARIFAQSSIAGVGPAGYKDAYLLAKNPLSPEEVASPHCLPADWLCTLGFAGIALLALWLLWCAGAGRALVDGAPVRDLHDDGDERTEGLLLALILCLPAALAGWIERAGASPDAAISRVAGLALGWIVATRCMRALREGLDVQSWLAAAGLAAAAQSMIEMVGIAPGVGAWSFCLLTLACARPEEKSTALRTPNFFFQLSRLALAGLAVYAGVMIWARAREAGTWEQHLGLAARACAGVQELTQRRNAFASSPTPPMPDDVRALADDASKQLGQPVPPDPRAIDAAIAALRERSLGTAIKELDLAGAASPSHFPTLRARSQCTMMLGMSMLERGSAEAGMAVMSQSPEQVERAVMGLHDRSTAWFWLGVISEQLAQQLTEEKLRAKHAMEALWAYEKSSILGPYEILAPMKLARLHAQMGHVDESKLWARKVLEIDELLRLDALERLTESQRAEFEGLAGQRR